MTFGRQSYFHVGLKAFSIIIWGYLALSFSDLQIFSNQDPHINLSFKCNSYKVGLQAQLLIPTWHTPKRHTHTHTACTSIPAVSTPPHPPLRFYCCLKLSWALVEGSRWHRQPTLIFYWTLFVLFILLYRCTATRGLTPISPLKWSSPPSPFLFYEKRVVRKMLQLFFLFVCFLPFKSQFSAQHLFPLLPLSLSAGILKFHEVYLGEGVSEGGTEFQEGSGGVISGSSLEQHIASAREALGVESYYSRWDVHSCHCEIRIVCLLAHYLYHNLLIWE